MKPIHKLAYGLKCESMTMEFRFPGTPLPILQQRLVQCRENGMIYHPYSLADDIDFKDNGWATIDYILKAGHAELLRFKLAPPKLSHLPTLTVQLNAELAFLMGGDQLAWRILSNVLNGPFSNWHTHGHIRRIRITADTNIPPDNLMIWEKYHHGKGPSSYGFSIGNKTEELCVEHGVTLPDQVYSLRWDVTPRAPIPFFSGPRKLPNPLSRVSIFDFMETLKLATAHPSFKELGIYLCMQNQSELNFSQAVKEQLTYHARQKLLTLLEPARVKLWTDNQWTYLWAKALRRWKCLGNFAA